MSNKIDFRLSRHHQHRGILLSPGTVIQVRPDQAERLECNRVGMRVSRIALEIAPENPDSSSQELPDDE